MLRLTAALLCMSAALAHADEVMPPAVLSAAGGRYVFGQVGLGRIDQYMLDTATGKLWQLVCVTRDAAGKCELTGLQLVPYLDGTGMPFTTPPAKK